MQYFRIRRGKVVEIPARHLGRITTKETKRQRRIIARCKVLKRKARLVRIEHIAYRSQEDYQRDQLYYTADTQSGGYAHGVF